MADASSVSNQTAKSYLDFNGLSQLRSQASQNNPQALKQTAQQFEGIFIQMMLKSMRDASSVMKSELNSSSEMNTYQDMYDKELSVQMSKRNSLGFADMIVKQLSQKTTTPNTTGLTNTSATPSTNDILQSSKGAGFSLHQDQLPKSLIAPEQSPIALPVPKLNPLKLHINGGTQ
jgi:Rod binding domain-containing protein